MTDAAFASEQFGVGVHAPMHESGREFGRFVVAKYDQDQTDFVSRQLGGEAPGRRGFVQPGPADFARFGIKPYEETEGAKNLLTQAGWGRMLNLTLGVAVTAYNAANTRIGVGTATAAATTGQTDLQAATGAANRQWKLLTGVGTTGTGTGTARLSFVATFGTGEANFAWQEFGTDNGTADGVAASTTPLLNRAVSNQGTKASGQTWTATELIDFT